MLVVDLGLTTVDSGGERYLVGGFTVLHHSFQMLLECFFVIPMTSLLRMVDRTNQL